MRHKAKRRGALPTRDLCKLGVCDDPGSAVHHFMLHLARDAVQISVAYPFRGIGFYQPEAKLIPAESPFTRGHDAPRFAAPV
jgi:hypothetical protein